MIVLLLPVLREQSTLAETLSHFANLDYPAHRLRIVIVSTELEIAERERDIASVESIAELVREGVSPARISAAYPGLGPPSLVTPILEQPLAHDPDALRRALVDLPTSWEAVEELAGVINASADEPVIRNIHYPFTKGIMAHQVNYAVRYLFEVVDEGIDPSRLYVGLYNADSRPQWDTLRHVARMVLADPERTVALQQYSSYRLASSSPGLLSSLVLHASALWQTRWALAVEMERSRRTERLMALASPWRLLLFLPFNYAIGHGLFVRLRELVIANYLPETVPNEDAPFGYFLLLAGIPLRPLRRLDNCEAPRSVTSLVSQQGGWFRGPFQAPTYLKMARRRKLTARVGELLSVILAWRVVRDALLWVLGPLLATSGLVLAIAEGGAPLAVFVAALAAYFVIPTIPAAFVDLRESSQQNTRPSLWRGLLGMPMFYALHGLGPMIAIFSWAWAASRGMTPTKYKTER